MTLYTGILIVGYFIFFLACVVAMLWWMRRQRQVRHPLDNDLRLLRMPGETQFKIITEFQENLFLYMVTAAYVPVFVETIRDLLAVEKKLGDQDAEMDNVTKESLIRVMAELRDRSRA